MLNTAFAPWPSYSREEADLVANVLLSNKVNYWTGEECRLFEKEFAAWAGTDYAVAINNGTTAIEIALLALGIGPGDEVIVTPRTFIASASAIIAVGARPVFADVDPDTQNISATTIRPVITERTRGIICVHLAGWPCEMDGIMALAAQHGIKVIEDCAQAHGARYRDRSVGAIGHIAAWSFCQDKIMTTAGEGGMVTTNDKALWHKVWSYKDHGKSWQSIYEKQHPPGFRWLHDSFGTNMRMTEIQAAVGRQQLKYMAEWHDKRTANATAIWETARQLLGLRVPVIPDHIEHAAYKAYVFVCPEMLKTGWSRDRIMEAINQAGVPCYSGSCSEIYLEKAFDRDNLRPQQRLPVAKSLGETSLMFLVHPTLTETEINLTCEAIDKIIKMACNVNNKPQKQNNRKPVQQPA